MVYKDYFAKEYWPKPEVNAAHSTSVAYLGYAALARLTPESIELGMSDLESADESQASRLRSAFSAAAQVLMEIRQLDDMPLATEPLVVVEVEVAPSETLIELPKQRLSLGAERYLSSLVGSVDDLDLNLGHIPVIVESLLNMRGPVERVESRSLDVSKLLTLYFSGLTRKEIGREIDVVEHRVKGAFARFGEAIESKLPLDRRGAILRNDLEFRHLLVYKDVRSTEQEDKAHPAVPFRTKSPNVRKVTKKVSTLVQRSPSNIRGLTDPKLFPSDLLEGETMGERRMRIQQEDAATKA